MDLHPPSIAYVSAIIVCSKIVDWDPSMNRISFCDALDFGLLMNYMQDSSFFSVNFAVSKRLTMFLR